MDANDEPVTRYLMGQNQAQIFAQENVDTVNDTLWTLTDALGSVREVVDNTGDAVNHIIYTAYGQIHSQTDDTSSVTMLFTGYVFDKETGQYYANHRYYDPQQHRFTTMDPMGFDAAGHSFQSRYAHQVKK